MTTKTETTPAPMMVALTSIHTESGLIAKGDELPATDSRVTQHSAYFAPASTSPQELRRLEGDLFAEAVADGWKPEPPPPPVRMRAKRPFHAEIITSTHRLVEKGETFMSDDPLFMDYPVYFEKADKPRRGGENNGR